MAEISTWDASDPLVWAEEVGNPPVALSLGHPTHPAEDTIAADDLSALRKVVAKYLTKVSPRLGLPALFSAGDDFQVFMGWLKLPSDNADVDPRNSHWVSRFKDPLNRAGPLDRTVVFIAGEAWKVNDSSGVLGSRMGLRVVAHVAMKPANKWHVRITSVARSIGLPEALASHATFGPEVANFYSLVFDPGNFTSFKTSVGVAAGITGPKLDLLSIDGVRAETVGGRSFGVVYATESRGDHDPPGPGYALTIRFAMTPGGGIGKRTVERARLLAHVVPVKANLFTRDPASREGLGKLVESRPNRSPDRLNAFKDANVVLQDLVLLGGGQTSLSSNWVDIKQSPLVTPGADMALPQEVRPGDVDNPRRNDFAALSGYEYARAKFDQFHLRPLIETIIAYGLAPNDYFRFAVAPLQIIYRSPIAPGPGKDGRTVNAQVDFNPPICDLVGEFQAWLAGIRRPLIVRFALADLKQTSSRRHPLGLAADPRWSWHEYCHVLLAAQTGRLELDFAHSAGDGLAAILSDPWSELATHEWARGYTFPWVYLHRRHDRAVNRGWGWNGRRHRQDRFPAISCACQHKGYESEQILSTSLFRLYRSLGGDTIKANGDPDRDARQRAADYTAYLILRAIKNMPAHFVGGMQTPAQFAMGLIDVDSNTTPMTSGPLKDRVGGWAHKVVRWAFEAQGLYAANPAVASNQPGESLPVDIFIDDNRPDSEGTYTRGGYMPVSLDWKGAAPRRWHATADAISIAGGQIRVRVRNRGRNVANNVTVSVWYVERSAGATSPPDWKSTAWNHIADVGPRVVPAWPTPAVTFAGFPVPAVPAGKRVWILAIADCPADRANTTSSTGLPCSTTKVSIVDLVAGDNNLGLRVIP